MPAAMVLDGVEIPERLIAEEAQHHPAATPADARALAARALAIKALLLNRAVELGLAPMPERDEAGREEAPEEALVRQVLAAEIDAPTPTEAECRRFYDARRAARDALPFEAVRASIERHLQTRAWAGAAARYVAGLAAAARAGGITLRLTDDGDVARPPLSLGALLSQAAESFGAWLEVADPALARRLADNAAASSASPGEVARGACADFFAAADDAAWTKLVTVMREAEDPALAGLAHMLKAKLAPPQAMFTVVRRRA